MKAKLESDQALECLKKKIFTNKLLLAQSQDKNPLAEFEKKYKKLTLALNKLYWSIFQ